jgi:deoxyribose-phosphate aldolase
MTNPPLSRAQLAAMVDHTLLTPESTDADVGALCEEGVGLGVRAICVNATRIPAAARALAGTGVGLAAVVGFPSGAHHTEVKAREAAIAVAEGADEVDMVIDLGTATEGHWDDVTADVAAVRRAAPAPVVLKVIIESAYLATTTGGEAAIVAACRAAEAAGADFVKTSTGFHPRGGASVEAVALMAGTVVPRLEVKASGGIRTAETAIAMVAAGATRLGMSRTASILAELES